MKQNHIEKSEFFNEPYHNKPITKSIVVRTYRGKTETCHTKSLPKTRRQKLLQKSAINLSKVYDLDGKQIEAAQD